MQPIGAFQGFSTICSYHLIPYFCHHFFKYRIPPMSVIQKIRDKYARWAVIAIALSLLGFILMDAFAGRTNVFGGNATTVGSINGEDIEIQDFEQKVKAQEEYAQQQGYGTGEEGRQQV